MSSNDEDPLTSLNCGSLHIGPRQKIVDLNEALASWRGRPRDALRGKDLDTLLSRGSWLYWDTAVEAMLDQQGHAWDVALNLRREKGDPVEVLVNARRDETGTRCVLFPFSGRRSWERRLVAAQAQAGRQQAEIERLERIESFRRDFVSAIAHELATPMKPLAVQLHLLQKDLQARPQPALQRRVDKMQASVDRLSRLTESIIRSADVAAGRIDLDVQPIELGQALEPIVQTWRQRHAPSRRIGLDVQDAVVQADRQALTTCLEHLLDNAARFSPSDTLIRVKALAGPPARIIVEDRGRGIDPTRLEGLGRPFVVAHDRTHVTTLGMGFGLHIVTGLMKAQGGSFRIESEGTGRGARAILEFPEDRTARTELRPRR